MDFLKKRSVVFGAISFLLITVLVAQTPIEQNEPAPSSGFFLTPAERDQVLAKMLEFEGLQEENRLLKAEVAALKKDKELCDGIIQEQRELLAAYKTEFNWLAKQKAPKWGSTCGLQAGYDPFDKDAALSLGCTIGRHLDFGGAK